jgi:LmbE family N-acetylglucosaminyl deacetylase
VIGRNVLVLAVHADDETLGCGGTLLKAKATGASTHWLIATREINARPIRQIGECYQFESVHELGFDSARLDTVPRVELLDSIAKVMNAVKPDTVFLPFYGDIHSDHRISFEAAYSCTKSFRYPYVTSVT